MGGAQELKAAELVRITTRKELDQRLALVVSAPLYRQDLGRAFVVAMELSWLLGFGLPLLALMLLGSTGDLLAPGFFLSILSIPALVPYLTYYLVDEPAVKELLRTYLAGSAELLGFLALVGSLLAYADLAAYQLHGGDFEFAFRFMGFIWISFLFPAFNYFFSRAAFIELKPLGKLFKGFVKPSLAGILLSLLVLPLTSVPNLGFLALVPFLTIGLPHVHQLIKFRRYHLMLLPGTGR